MDKFIVSGGNELRGTISVSGAKNSALKVLCASILTDEKIRLFNMPTKIEDVKVQIDMLKSIGSNICVRKDQVTINNSFLEDKSVQMEKRRGIRTSLLMLGCLLARFGKARVPLPGGDDIGNRKFELHVHALECLGAEVEITKDGYIQAKCDKLHGSEIEFPIQTTGGTENAMIVASLAEGATIIKNAHTRPEVIDLAKFLNEMGAKIRIKGSGYIEIEGVKELYGTNYKIISDSVEALTFVIAATMTKGEVEIDNCPTSALEIPLIYLREAGINFYKKDNSLLVLPNSFITLFDLSTGPYPGINSDFQPLFAALATQAIGRSKITDIRFSERFKYSDELNKMGANIIINGNKATINGNTNLCGAKVKALDIRTGAALIAAGLCARGETIIENAYQIDRGYERIEEKLSSLGANIIRITE